MSIRILQQTDTSFAHEKIQFSLSGYCFDFGPRGAKDDPTGLITAPGHIGGPRAAVRQADTVVRNIWTEGVLALEWVAIATIMVEVHPHFDDEKYNVASHNCMTYTRMAGARAESAIHRYINGRSLGSQIENLTYDLAANSDSVLTAHFDSMANGGGY
ncbi:MAG: hypothetical protein AAGF11_31770 [Myxococcota bacterium]